jgi:hypothetical protein
MSITLPIQTVRDFGELVAHLLHTTFSLVEDLFRGLSDWTEPPADLEVRSREGWRYTGCLVIESNHVTSGAVVRMGHEGPRPAPYQPPAPPQRPWSGSDDRSQLSHWAADRRDEEDPPWPRR